MKFKDFEVILISIIAIICYEWGYVSVSIVKYMTTPQTQNILN